MSTAYFDTEEIDDIFVMKSCVAKIIDTLVIQAMGNQLYAFVEIDKRMKIVLDFTGITYMASEFLGKLIAFEKKMKEAKGTLRLCSMDPEIYEVFQITRLNKYFVIRQDQEEAFKDM
jgi:anti-sigma B factor antagonist